MACDAYVPYSRMTVSAISPQTVPTSMTARVNSRAPSLGHSHSTLLEQEELMLGPSGSRRSNLSCALEHIVSRGHTVSTEHRVVCHSLRECHRATGNTRLRTSPRKRGHGGEAAKGGEKHQRGIGLLSRFPIASRKRAAC